MKEADKSSLSVLANSDPGQCPTRLFGTAAAEDAVHQIFLLPIPPGSSKLPIGSEASTNASLRPYNHSTIGGPVKSEPTKMQGSASQLSASGTSGSCLDIASRPTSGPSSQTNNWLPTFISRTASATPLNDRSDNGTSTWTLYSASS